MKPLRVAQIHVDMAQAATDAYATIMRQEHRAAGWPELMRMAGSVMLADLERHRLETLTGPGTHWDVEDYRKAIE